MYIVHWSKIGSKGIVWGRGKKNKTMGNWLRYYAYLKMITAKMVFIRFKGVGQSTNLGSSCPQTSSYDYVSDNSRGDELVPCCTPQ